MDLEKMKQWMEMAKQFQDGKFWDSVFEMGYTGNGMEQSTKSPAPKTPATKFPPADIFQNNREFIIVMDLPGVRKEDVEISVTNNYVDVKGNSNRVNSEMLCLQTERFNGDFERTFALPESIVSGENIKATFNNGTLEIRIPRSRKPKERIKIE